MDAVLRAAAIYFFLLILFRLAGRRTFAEMTSFDFVLLLVIGEATQQALLGDDFSVINAFIVIVALIAIDILFSLAQSTIPGLSKFINGEPMIVVEHVKPLLKRLKRARVSVDDVLGAARETRGLEHIGQIKFAVLEPNGAISIIPEDEWR
jgi:uncharacterized membrane protein YcaP (DUF421 family)